MISKIDKFKPEPLRVLQVFTILERAGAESMIMNYYRSIDKTKIQFDFLVHREEKGAFEDEIVSLGGQIFRLPKITNHFQYKQALRNFFKKHSYKIVHSHIDSYGYWVLKYAKKNKVPVRIAHSHIAVNLSPKKMFLSKSDFIRGLKSMSQYMLKSGLKKNANYYFSCGEKAGEWMYGKDFNAFTIIRNAIHTNDFKLDMETRRTMREQLGIAEDEFVIGHVGRFAIQKNHVFLLAIFKELHKSNKKFTLVLVGDGDLRNKMAQMVEELGMASKVKFLGIRKDIPQLLQAFDLFLFPSIFEGLPVTMVEAQVSGLPIIASDTITNEVNITNLVTNVSLQENPSKWANIILEKAQNVKRYDRSKEIVNSGYDIQANAEKLQEFYLSK